MPKTHAQVEAPARRVIGYLRVSTEQQEQSGLGLAAQADTIQRECAHRGWELVGTEQDVISAGKDLDERTGLERAIARVEAREADGLVIARVDRLVRSVGDLATLLQRSQRRGWTITCLDIAGVDTSTPIGELVVSVLAAVARFERRLIGERTSAAMRAMAARGEPVGRPLGSTPEVQARIVRMADEGLTAYRIATMLNEGGTPSPLGRRWHKTSVRRVLERHRRLVANGRPGLG